MTERYPNDATLLAIEEDNATGVEYIPTGKSPYYLEFRKTLQRLLLATERANDLRVYEDGDLTIGVRAGRYVIDDSATNFACVSTLAVSNNATTTLWLNSVGSVVSGTSGLPSDRTTFVPLADVMASGGVITTIIDLRGEAMVNVAGLGSFSITATKDEINQALAGINASVTQAALDTLTEGSLSVADTHHTHRQLLSNENAEVPYRIINNSSLGNASVAIQFELPNIILDTPSLFLDKASGTLHQRHASESLSLVGVMNVSDTRSGALSSSETNRLMGAVKASGEIIDVFLSVGTNIQSSTGTDGVSATVKINGTAVTSTDPAIDSVAGTGFKSTAQSDGTAGVVKNDGTEMVTIGDILTVDITRSVSGTASQEATDLVVVIVLAPTGPR